MRIALTLAAIALCAGCIGTMGPLRGESGQMANRLLTPGMTLEELRTTLAHSGNILPGLAEEFTRDKNGEFTPKRPTGPSRIKTAVFHYDGLPEEDQKRVQTIVVQLRSYDAFGLDAFYLYLDAKDRLVAYKMDRVR